MASKITQVDGVDYVVPDNYDPAIFKQQLEIEKAAGLALGQQKLAAERAPATLEQSKGASMQDLRRSAAQSLATQRGLVGGGRGLGLARDVAESTGVAAGRLSADYDTRIAQARQEAAAAGLEVATQQGKLLEAQASRKAAGSAAAVDADKVVEDFKGKIFTTKQDRNLMVQALERKRNAATNPEAAQAYQNKINEIKGGNFDAPGSIDISF
jgi:hypothetical protein